MRWLALVCALVAVAFPSRADVWPPSVSCEVALEDTSAGEVKRGWEVCAAIYDRPDVPLDRRAEAARAAGARLLHDALAREETDAPLDDLSLRLTPAVDLLRASALLAPDWRTQVLLAVAEQARSSVEPAGSLSQAAALWSRALWCAARAAAGAPGADG